jgi:hypothetical protein
MKNYYDDFDGFNNRRYREVVSKKNKYEDEEDLDDLHIIADDISEKYLSTYGIHNITASTAKSAVVIYIDEMSDITSEIQKEIKEMAKPYSAIFKESKLKSDKQHLEDIIKN